VAHNGAAQILHADLDAFYASVALLENPSLVGRPMAVGGGVVLSCTYEARQFGVQGGMSLGEAKRLCPRLIVLGGEFGAYTEYSDRVMAIFRDFTPLVEPVSIDEAFLDVSGATHLFGTPEAIARAIRARVRSETGLPISVGVARTKHLAKVASRVAKPDGLIVVPPDTELAFLHQLTVDHLWGVGPVTTQKLADHGISTVGEIAATPYRTLARWFGAGAGGHMYALAWNRDPRRVQTHRKAGSVGAQSAFARDERAPEAWHAVLAGLATRVGARLRKKGRAGRTITLRARFSDFSSVTRAHTMGTPTAATSVLYRVSGHLVDELMTDAPGRGLSLLGISVSKLGPPSPLQLELALFPDDDLGGSVRELELQALDRSVDELQERFGKETVGAASVLLGRRRPFAEGLSAIMTRGHDAAEAPAPVGGQDEETEAEMAGSPSNTDIAAAERRNRKRREHDDSGHEEPIAG
jgi:DNA polymerase-4